MLTPDQLTTIRAALRYWRDEIVPAGSTAASFYYEASVGHELQAAEIESLIQCFQPDQTRCVLITPHDVVLAVTRTPAIETGPNRNATLVFGPKS